MMEGYGWPVLVERPWGASRYRGPGHVGLYRDGDRDIIVYHLEDSETNIPVLRLAEIVWDAEGWPVAIM